MSYKKSYKFLFYIFPIFFFVSCNVKNRGEWEVLNLNRDTLFNVDTGVCDATTLILTVKGFSDDSIKVYGTVIPGGNIDRELRFDWYNPKIAVQYESYRAKNGKIKIYYNVPSSY